MNRLFGRVVFKRILWTPPPTYQGIKVLYFQPSLLATLTNTRTFSSEKDAIVPVLPAVDDDVGESTSVDEDDDDDDDSDEDSDESEEKPKKTKPVRVKGDDDDDDDMWDEDSETESDESDADDGRPELKGRAKWLKKAVDNTATAKKEAKILKKMQQNAEPSKKKKDTFDVNKSSKSTWRMEDYMSEEAIDKKVNELVASRGRKGTDMRVVLRQLEMLAKAAKVHGPRKEIPVTMHVISAMFDAHRSIDDFMDLEKWRTCHRSLSRVMFLLDAHPELQLQSMPIEDVLEGGKDKRTEDSSAKEEAANRGILHVVGSIESFITLLEDEYTKSLQQINPHTQDYVVRLSDETLLFELAESVQAYYHRINDGRAAAVVALMQLEHLYYKHDSMAKAILKSHLFAKTWGRYADLHPACLGKIDEVPKKLDVTNFHPAALHGTPTVVPPKFEPEEKIDQLCSCIYKLGDERCKTRALLCAVFHHALHDRFYRARDLFLISHVQDSIDKADTKTQILYNRALVMMGLAAFRQGLIQKAHDCLASICSGRVRELLAQGQTRWHDKDPEQEKAERRRQMPYHMHINPDLLDCCHLTCAMLLELPQMAKQTPNQTIISRHFRKYLQTYNRQVFTGPPENTREHVLVAAKALLAGDWRKACDYLTGLEVWKLIPNFGGDAVKEMLRKRIREEGLHLYLLSFGVHYESISLSQLCEMFDTESSAARCIISKMIFQREILAAWESPADTLVLYKMDASPLQVLSVQVADKLGQFVESNERLLDPLAGVYGYKDDWSGRDGRKNWMGADRDRSGGRDRDREKSDRDRGGDREDGGRERRAYKGGWKAASNFVQPPRYGGGAGRGGGGGQQGQNYRNNRSGGASNASGGRTNAGAWGSSSQQQQPSQGMGGMSGRSGRSSYQQSDSRQPFSGGRTQNRSTGAQAGFGDGPQKKSVGWSN